MVRVDFDFHFDCFICGSEDDGCMTSFETASAVIDTQKLAAEIARASANQTHTIGEYTVDIRAAASSLMQVGGDMTDVAAHLQTQAEKVEEAAEGGTSIGIDALDTHVTGQTIVGGTDATITVSRDILDQHDQLAETIAHERRHNEQTTDILEEQKADAILITASGKTVENVLVLQEGDTETHTAHTLSFGKRDDMPAEVYGEGYEVATEVRGEHAGAWDKALTEDGNLAALQQEIWQKGLMDGSLTLDQLAQQAAQTGYSTEAARAIEQYLTMKPQAALQLAA